MTNPVGRYGWTCTYCDAFISAPQFEKEPAAVHMASVHPDFELCECGEYVEDTLMEVHKKQRHPKSLQNTPSECMYCGTPVSLSGRQLRLCAWHQTTSI